MADTLKMRRVIYRGYRIVAFGEGRSWSYGVEPIDAALPSTGCSIFMRVGTSESAAIEVAKNQIDRLLDRHDDALADRHIDGNLTRND